jgi:hypothetical protein
MPRMDGTGPMGSGSMTGRGYGFCAGDGAIKREAGRGMGAGRGFAYRRGRGFAKDFAMSRDSQTQKELLNEQKAMLQYRIEAIDRQLENQ